jgi:Ser/Thr protein kinase RdoA (MazF antagonist)
MPDETARLMGMMLWQLHEALAELPNRSEGPSWRAPDRSSFDDMLRNLLDLASARRPVGAIDEIARMVLEGKLRSSDVPPPPDEPCQWLHGDYIWRNALIDAYGQVAAVIDFDNMRFLPRSYDVMRSFSLGFDVSTIAATDVDSTAAESFFSGYARAAGLTPDDVRTYVSSWRYTSTFRLWPLDVRYLDPIHYDPVWDQFIPSLRPHPPAEWESLVDRLTTLVTAPRPASTLDGKPV